MLVKKKASMMKNKNSDNEEQNLNSEDSYSDQSFSSEDSNSFEEDNWIVLEKNDMKKSVKIISKEYMMARKNKKVCCKNTFSQTESFYNIKLRKKENTIRRFKMEAKKKAKEYIKNM